MQYHLACKPALQMRCLDQEGLPAKLSLALIIHLLHMAINVCKPCEHGSEFPQHDDKGQLEKMQETSGCGM